MVSPRAIRRAAREWKVNWVEAYYRLKVTKRAERSDSMNGYTIVNPEGQEVAQVDTREHAAEWLVNHAASEPDLEEYLEGWTVKRSE